MAEAAGARFVGRSDELRILRAELASTLAGEGRLVLVEGEAGIGKTRIASALAAEARAAGALVVWGRCHEGEAAPAYWPWVGILRECLSGCAGGGAELGAVLEELRSRGAERGDAPHPDERFELLDRVAQTLCELTRKQPLLIVIDDLQWADVGSLQVLEFAARELRAQPLLLLATLRRPQPGVDAARERVRGLLARCARSILLAGLDAEAVRELLTACLGRAPADSVVSSLHRTSGGNPFFVIELAHLLGPSARGAALASAEIPSAVRHVLRERLANLGDASVRVLEAASVLGDEFDLVLAGAALGFSLHDLLEALEEPLARGLVREVPDGVHRFAFTHALLREALHAGLTPLRCAELHGAVATALEAQGAAGDERLSALAHHLFQSARPGDAARAVRYGCAAGEQALRVFAYEEARHWFERAAAAAALGVDDADRLRVLVGLAEATHGAGEVALASARFDDALALARRLGAREFAATALRSAEVRAEMGVFDAALNALLDEALTGLSAEPTPLRARLMARLASGLNMQPGARRPELVEEAIETARALEDPATQGYVLVRALFCLGPDDLARRLAISEEVLRAGASSLTAEREVLGLRAVSLAERGDRAGFDQVLAAFEQKAQASRNPRPLWTLATFRAALALLEGRFGEAESLARDALALGTRVMPQTAPLRFAQQLFMLRGWQGRLAEVAPLLERGAQTALIPVWRAALALFHQLAGREDDARREFEVLASADFADLPRDSTWLAAMTLIAWLCARLGDTRRAEIVYGLLEPYADRVAVAGTLVVVVGPVASRLGVLAGMLGRFDEAEAHFATALAIGERMRALPSRAEALFHWAEMLRARSARADRERAAAMLDQAEAIAAPIGMQMLCDWIAQSRKTAWRAPAAVAAAGGRSAEVGAGERGTVISLGQRRAASAVASAAGPAPLPRTGTFRREGGVWTLVFEGRTTHVPDLRGLAHIARLLREPGRELHVSDLAGDAHAADRDAGGSLPPGDAGKHLDSRARAEYEARLREAREELDQAERRNDLGAIERMREEIELLTSELARGFGLGGRARRAGDPTERARISVTRAIRYAIDRIAEHDAALAEHLRHFVRTGTFCAYEPSARERLTWAL